MEKFLLAFLFLFFLPSLAHADIISGPTFVYYRYIAENGISITLGLIALIAIIAFVMVRKRRKKRK